MTSPSVVGSPGTTSLQVDGTSRAINMPSGTVTKHNVLLMFLTLDGPPTINSGLEAWTLLGSASYSSGGLFVYAKVADGTEGGTTVTINLSAAEAAAANVYEVTTWGGTLTTADIVIAIAEDLSTSTSDPPSASWGWGSQDALAFAVSSCSQNPATAAPSGYGSLTGTGGGGASANAAIATATKTLTAQASPENPGTFTVAGTFNHASATVVIRTGTGAFTTEQEGYRWRNDDGSESGATWMAAQDTTTNVPVSQTKRLRTIVNADGNPTSQAVKLQYRKQGDPTSEWETIA